MNSYKFRVLLDTEKNEIFRDISVQKNASMEDFFKGILNAFDFKGNQMASFYKSNDNWDKGFEITLLDMQLDADAEPVAIMSEHKVREFVSETDQKLILVYDFMRMWIFLIELVEECDSKEVTEILLSVGKAPKESSKELNENYMFDTDESTSDDPYDFDDDYDNDDFGDLEDYSDLENYEDF